MRSIYGDHILSVFIQTIGIGCLIGAFATSYWSYIELYHGERLVYVGNHGLHTYCGKYLPRDAAKRLLVSQKCESKFSSRFPSVDSELYLSRKGGSDALVMIMLCISVSIGVISVISCGYKSCSKVYCKWIFVTWTCVSGVFSSVAIVLYYAELHQKTTVIPAVSRRSKVDIILNIELNWSYWMALCGMGCQFVGSVIFAAAKVPGATPNYDNVSSFIRYYYTQRKTNNRPSNLNNLFLDNPWDRYSYDPTSQGNVYEGIATVPRNGTLYR